MEAEADGISGEGQTEGKKRRGRPTEGRKIALNLRLDPAIHQQVKVHALLTNSTASEIVSELVRRHLKIYTVNGPVDQKSGEG